MRVRFSLGSQNLKQTEIIMNKEEALEIFLDWYDNCINNGIAPEEIVDRVGGMALITNDELVMSLKQAGKITGSY